MADDPRAPEKAIDPPVKPSLAPVIIPTLGVIAEVLKKIADDLPIAE
jgi:hypothetical protein